MLQSQQDIDWSPEQCNHPNQRCKWVPSAYCEHDTPDLLVPDPPPLLIPCLTPGLWSSACLLTPTLAMTPGSNSWLQPLGITAHTLVLTLVPLITHIYIGQERVTEWHLSAPHTGESFRKRLSCPQLLVEFSEIKEWSHEGQPCLLTKVQCHLMINGTDMDKHDFHPLSGDHWAKQLMQSLLKSGLYLERQRSRRFEQLDSESCLIAISSTC